MKEVSSGETKMNHRMNLWTGMKLPSVCPKTSSMMAIIADDGSPQRDFLP